MTAAARVKRLEQIGAFAKWQPVYAEYGIATFPVLVEGKVKKPLIKHFQSVGLNGSRELARKFATAESFGFILGHRSRITVLDIDTPDERILADALDRHGPSPLIVRSGRGHWQGWYRHNGEP